MRPVVRDLGGDYLDEVAQSISEKGRDLLFVPLQILTASLDVIGELGESGRNHKDSDRRTIR